MKTSHLRRLRARGPAPDGPDPVGLQGDTAEKGENRVRAVRPVAVLFSLLVTLALAWGASAADRLVIWDKTEYIPFYNEFMAQFVQAWSEATGIEVEYTVVPPRDLITKLMTAVESGHVPDIATVEVGMVAQLAGMGATTITADLLAAIEAQTGDRFSEAAVRLVSIDGQPRGVPTATFPAALFYRNDLLEAAGVEPPQTIAAFREVARRTNNPRAGIYGAGIPLGRSGGNDNRRLHPQPLLGQRRLGLCGRRPDGGGGLAGERRGLPDAGGDVPPGQDHPARGPVLG